MRKSAVVATHMQQSLSDIEWLHGSMATLDDRPLIPFAEETIEQLNALSTALLRDPLSRQYPDVVTFGFFCRKANLLKLKEQHSHTGLRLGRGIVFHIAPSNVPVNFAYSIVAGLLAGNTNVVRVSQKAFPQVDIIVRHMCEIGMERVAVVRYAHDSAANEVFSSKCDVRAIWGGDATITTIRKHALPARAFDICFADRYSLAVINADKLIEERDMDSLALKFYNDTYLFDQNACSAPHLVVWLGATNSIVKAKEMFWPALQRVVEQKYTFQDVMAVDKLTALYRQAVAMPTHAERTKDNLLCRVEIDTLASNIDAFRCASGYFTEYTAKNIDEIANIITSKYQTLAYYGVEKNELEDFALHNRLTGIDRIVPFGDTTAFSLIWDGNNLINIMSRIVDIK